MPLQCLRLRLCKLVAEGEPQTPPEGFLLESTQHICFQSHCHCCTEAAYACDNPGGFSCVGVSQRTHAACRKHHRPKPRGHASKCVSWAGAQHCVPAGEWEAKCSEMQRLLLVRCLRPDRVIFACTSFVGNALGRKFVEPPGLDLGETYADSTPASPLIFVLSAGIDPTASLRKLGAEMGMADKIFAVALGQGQVRAHSLLHSCKQIRSATGTQPADLAGQKRGDGWDRLTLPSCQHTRGPSQSAAKHKPNDAAAQSTCIQLHSP